MIDIPNMLNRLYALIIMFLPNWLLFLVGFVALIICSMVLYRNDKNHVVRLKMFEWFLLVLAVTFFVAFDAIVEIDNQLFVSPSLIMAHTAMSRLARLYFFVVVAAIGIVAYRRSVD